MATATDATATPYLNTAASCRSRRLCASPLRRHQTGRELLLAVAETGRRGDACQGHDALHSGGVHETRVMASGTSCTTVVMECRCATPALRRRGSASGSCRSVISSRAWDAEGLENQSLALNSTIPAEPAAREAFRRGAARYERLPHALDAPRGASRTGRVARAEMRSAEERSRARLWSSKAPHSRRPVAANHNTGVSTPIKASTREAGVVVAGL